MSKFLFLAVTLLLIIGTIHTKAPEHEIKIAAKASEQAYNVNTDLVTKDELKLTQFYQNPKGSFCKVFTTTANNKKILVISYRGSATTNDWSNNFNIDTVTAVLGPNNDKHGKVHEGFMDSYKASRSGLFTYLKNLLSNEKFDRVIFTGHSQGGAVAMISIYEFLLNYPEYQSKSRVELITFGQPKLGKSDFNTKFNSVVKNYTRIVSVFVEEVKDSKGNIIERNADEDLVTQIPPSFLGFKHVGEKIDVMCTSASVTKCHDMSTYLSAVNKGFFLN